MEILISLTVISILIISSIPLITQFSSLKTNLDKNVLDCINKDSSAGWYDIDGAGATTIPAAETSCYGAVIDITYNREKAFNAAYSIALLGTENQKTMAKKILRAACDQGSSKACDYFINHCRLNGLTTSPYCNETGETDISYYLHLPSTTSTNKGAIYIINQLTELLPQLPTNLLSEAFNAKITNPNGNSNLAYTIAQPWIYIKACNDGISVACTTAYNSYYNRSCYQIKNNWSTAPSQIYKITYNATTGVDSKYCNMNSLASAAITGCQSMTTGQWGQTTNNDCYFGRVFGYNNTCDVIFSSWPQAPNGTYNLTWQGSTAATVIPTACPIISTDCHDKGPGAVCPDGTIYAGYLNGHHYYTTPGDQGAYSWGTFANNTFTNIFSPDDGANNTLLLHNLSDPPDGWAPYNASNACYNANDLGYVDWYLPAQNEIQVLLTNKTAIGNFNNGQYWTSTENNATSGRTGYFTSNYTTSDNKWVNNRVRCIRKKSTTDETCPLIGDLCTDGSKYAGSFTPAGGNTYYLYTTPIDKGQFTWNDGTYIGTVTGFIDQNYGMPNYTGLITLADSFSPYNAALACKTLNDSSTYGYTDWYLPARYELNYIGINANAIGGFFQGSYWSSTEYSLTNAYYYNIPGRYDGGYGKTAINRVRCVRRSP